MEFIFTNEKELEETINLLKLYMNMNLLPKVNVFKFMDTIMLDGNSIHYNSKFKIYEEIKDLWIIEINGDIFPFNNNINNLNLYAKYFSII